MNDRVGSDRADIDRVGSDRAGIDLGAAVAANVRAERGRRRWTQAELADKLGWSRPVITAVEAGCRQVLVDELPQLCRVFNIPLTRLLQDADPDDLTALGLDE